MRDVTKIADYGKTSFRKARLELPTVKRLRPPPWNKDCVAHSVQSQDATKPEYFTTIKPVGNRIYADCVETITGARCQGFATHNHCYHLAGAMIKMDLMAKRAERRKTK